MGLLKSVDNVPNVNFYEYRDSTYFGKYEYRARITFFGIRRTYFSSDVDSLKERLNKRGHYGGLNAEQRQEILDNIESFRRFFEFKDKIKKNKKCGMRVEYDTCAVFGNDLQELLELKKVDPNAQFDITQVQTASLVGVKHFVKEPKHKFRVYLRSKKVPDNFKEQFNEFISKNKNLYTSPALKSWLRSDKRTYFWYSSWLSSGFFIDYDDESTLSYLALMYGDLLGKRYKLEKRPDPI